jgi:hypothetical protein
VVPRGEVGIVVTQLGLSLPSSARSSAVSSSLWPSSLRSSRRRSSSCLLFASERTARVEIGPDAVSGILREGTAATAEIGDRCLTGFCHVPGRCGMTNLYALKAHRLRSKRAAAELRVFGRRERRGRPGKQLRRRRERPACH